MGADGACLNSFRQSLVEKEFSMISKRVRGMRAARSLGPAFVVALLAACGGGGGSPPPPGDINVTATNQDTLTRASMVGLVGGLATDQLTLSARSGANAVGARVRALADVTSGRKRAAAVTVPVVTPCNVSGSTSESFDDANNNGTLDLNEAYSIVFNACRDDALAPDTEINGVLTFAVSAVRSSGSTLTGFTAAVSPQGYITTWTGHSLRLDGGFTMAIDATSSTTGQTVIAVGNSLSIQAVTPVWSDRITLQAGYQTVLAVDTVAASTTTTASGTVRSDLAGGYVTARTTQPLVQLSSDPYPRSGRVEVLGKSGSLQGTVLSTTQVQVDLDADGNGVYEASKTLGWDQIL